MKITPARLPEILIIDPDVHRDTRGYFLETWHAEQYASAGLDVDFVQDNHSASQRNTLRGLHLQLTKPQGKLIRASAGEIFDVAVDVRQGSPTYGQHVSVILSAENFRQVWIPEGFAHGFCVISEHAEMQYKCTDVYDPSGAKAIAWNDPDIGIDWPTLNPILSGNDQVAPRLADCRAADLPVYSK